MAMTEKELEEMERQLRRLTSPDGGEELYSVEWEALRLAREASASDVSDSKEAEASEAPHKIKK